MRAFPVVTALLAAAALIPVPAACEDEEEGRDYEKSRYISPVIRSDEVYIFDSRGRPTTWKKDDDEKGDKKAKKKKKKKLTKKPGKRRPKGWGGKRRKPAPPPEEPEVEEEELEEEDSGGVSVGRGKVSVSRSKPRRRPTGQRLPMGGISTVHGGGGAEGEGKGEGKGGEGKKGMPIPQTPGGGAPGFGDAIPGGP